MDTSEINDLKADSVRARFDLRWYEFAILPCETEWCQERARGLLQESSDPSAGFVRYYITRYVEEFGKLSSGLTEWLLKSVVIAPYCALVDCHEQEEAVVFFRPAEYLLENGLPAFDPALEAEWSRRYWSRDCNEDSRQRLRDFVVPAPGRILVDPRTYHSNG
ncbi:MAG TPA: hypothetical protein VMT86_23020 [Bryobacteraceae bacterium]|nr:hypothetical protein [Bryobacteraceae bacterium]